MGTKSPITTLLLKQMTDLRLKGKTNKEIAFLTGYSESFVQVHLREAGVKRPTAASSKPKVFKKIKAVGME